MTTAVWQSDKNNKRAEIIIIIPVNHTSYHFIETRTNNLWSDTLDQVF